MTHQHGRITEVVLILGQLKLSDPVAEQVDPDIHGNVTRVPDCDVGFDIFGEFIIDLHIHFIGLKRERTNLAGFPVTGKRQIVSGLFQDLRSEVKGKLVGLLVFGSVPNVELNGQLYIFC